MMDRTAGLFMYYDFTRGSLIVEDELEVEKDSLDSQTLTDLIKLKETALGYTVSLMRVADTGNPILLRDWATRYGLAFGYPKKTSVRAMVNEARVWFKMGRILIHPRCQRLISCIKSQLWAKDSMGQRMDDPVHSEAHGHADVLMALIYGVREAATIEHINPIPAREIPRSFDMIELSPRVDPSEGILKAAEERLDS